MHYSINEIAALSKRAARGAGLSWGLAEEAAYAARLLSGAALPGPALLAKELLQLDNTSIADVSPRAFSEHWQGQSGQLSPLISGVFWSDSARLFSQCECLQMQQVRNPLLLLPFAVSVARQIDLTVALEWPQVQVFTDGEHIGFTGSPEALSQHSRVDVTCSATNTSFTALSRQHSGHIDDTTLNILTTLAERTYAPATEESRMKGAGTGVD